MYLLDDGKDKKKRKWASRLGPDVVYVSGRYRATDETNGKSGNLNNALTQIYPDGVKIPLHEIVCIMDADQVSALASESASLFFDILTICRLSQLRLHLCASVL